MAAVSNGGAVCLGHFSPAATQASRRHESEGRGYAPDARRIKRRRGRSPDLRNAAIAFPESRTPNPESRPYFILIARAGSPPLASLALRAEAHPSDLQSLLRLTYAVI